MHVYICHQFAVQCILLFRYVQLKFINTVIVNALLFNCEIESMVTKYAVNRRYDVRVTSLWLKFIFHFVFAFITTYKTSVRHSRTPTAIPRLAAITLWYFLK